MDGRACQDTSDKMHGTTSCPHCDTRFKVTKVQLESHQGMVRCGHCLQPFDIHPNFTPDQLDLELDLPVLDSTEPDSPQSAVQQPKTLAEQVAIVRDDDSKFLVKRRTWPWAIAASLLLVVLLAQVTYFYRVDLAARLPGLKPTLISYCMMLKCSVPLPQHTDLIGLESSEMEADPTNENQITLDALLRNRAPYAQAFPNLELTLNDIQDKPLARRLFIPADYLPPTEKEPLGLASNHELNIKLHLNTAGFKPSGYRLVLLYSSS
jgi:predicted Zn finger-like uncharacterized protein